MALLLVKRENSSLPDESHDMRIIAPGKMERYEWQERGKGKEEVEGRRKKLLR